METEPQFSSHYVMTYPRADGSWRAELVGPPEFAALGRNQDDAVNRLTDEIRTYEVASGDRQLPFELEVTTEARARIWKKVQARNFGLKGPDDLTEAEEDEFMDMICEIVDEVRADER